MTTTALTPTLVRPVARESRPAAATVVASAQRASARPLAAALFIEAATALAFTVAISTLAGSMNEAAAVGLRMAAGGSFVVAILAWALGRRGVLRRRPGSYTAAALLQVAITLGISVLGFAASDPTLLAILLPAPLLTFGALCLGSVREALGQS
jgi:hypothetical protein